MRPSTRYRFELELEPFEVAQARREIEARWELELALAASEILERRAGGSFRVRKLAELER